MIRVRLRLRARKEFKTSVRVT
jgi:hypothetical protein